MQNKSWSPLFATSSKVFCILIYCFKLLSIRRKWKNQLKSHPQHSFIGFDGMNSYLHVYRKNIFDKTTKVEYCRISINYLLLSRYSTTGYKNVVPFFAMIVVPKDLYVGRHIERSRTEKSRHNKSIKKKCIFLLQ
jgi:hypothetical protein